MASIQRAIVVPTTPHAPASRRMPAGKVPSIGPVDGSAISARRLSGWNTRRTYRGMSATAKAIATMSTAAAMTSIHAACQVSASLDSTIARPALPMTEPNHAGCAWIESGLIGTDDERSAIESSPADVP